MSVACARAGCLNAMTAGQVVCSGDFAALAGMCRGKKRWGEPMAAFVQGRGGGQAYTCSVCLQWHNGAKLAGDARRRLHRAAEATVAAMKADPRVGWRGVLELADAWAPTRVNRSEWAEGLDQRVMLVLL